MSIFKNIDRKFFIPVSRLVIPVLLVVSLCCWYFCCYLSSPLTTIILVRHADRDGAADALDPVKGPPRTLELRRILDEANVQVIYSTNTVRTMATVNPLATQLGLVVQPYDATNLQALEDEIRAQHSGKTVLVVGHSGPTESVTATIGLFAIPAPPAIPGNEYDHLYVLTFGRRCPTKLLKMEYGAETP
ncbi:MAG: hypothetical protein ACKVT2_05945 [Saprospiraceae bacterium]